MTEIIDLAVDPTARLDQLKAAGIKTIISYLSSINPGGDKCWSLARVKAAAAKGFRIGLVHEGWGGVGGRGISAADGARDGKFCRVKAASLGAPKGACVYFACDTDFTAAQIKLLVIPYFKEIRAAFGDQFYRVGVYGSGAVCSALKSAGLVDLTWLAQSRGWAGYKDWLSKADLVQGAAMHIAGLDVDPNTAHGDFGDFVPLFDGQPVADRSVAALQRALNALGAMPALGVDDILGNETRGAIRAFQQRAGITVDGIAGPQTWAAIEARLKAP